MQLAAYLSFAPYTTRPLSLSGDGLSSSLQVYPLPKTGTRFSISIDRFFTSAVSSSPEQRTTYWLKLGTIHNIFHTF